MAKQPMELVELVPVSDSHPMACKCPRHWVTHWVEAGCPQNHPAFAREISGWQPIETAPKDGTEILVAFRRHGVKSVQWGTPEGMDNPIWCVDDHKLGPFPMRGVSTRDELGWMPLPAPPEGK